MNVFRVSLYHTKVVDSSFVIVCFPMKPHVYLVHRLFMILTSNERLT